MDDIGDEDEVDPEIKNDPIYILDLQVCEKRCFLLYVDLKTNYNLPISRIRENVVNFISRLDVILENEHSPS